MRYPSRRPRRRPPFGVTNADMLWLRTQRFLEVHRQSELAWLAGVSEERADDFVTKARRLGTDEMFRIAAVVGYAAEDRS